MCIKRRPGTDHLLVSGAPHAVQLALHAAALHLSVGQTGTELVRLHAGAVQLRHGVVAGAGRVTELCGQEGGLLPGRLELLFSLAELLADAA